MSACQNKKTDQNFPSPRYLKLCQHKYVDLYNSNNKELNMDSIHMLQLILDTTG